MTNRTTRPATIELEPGVHLLRCANDDRATVLLEIWLNMDGACVDGGVAVPGAQGHQ